MAKGWMNGIDSMKSSLMRTAAEMTEWMKSEMLAVDTGTVNTSVVRLVSPSAYPIRERSVSGSVQSADRPIIVESVLNLDGRAVARATAEHVEEREIKNIYRRLIV